MKCEKMKKSKHFEGLSEEDRVHYASKLTLSTREKLLNPFILTKDQWTSDITLPNIGWRDVTEYLINTPSIFTNETMKAYKSLEAYDYFVGGHVQDCFYHPLSKESKFCYIKSKVSLL